MKNAKLMSMLSSWFIESSKNFNEDVEKMVKNKKEIEEVTSYFNFDDNHSFSIEDIQDELNRLKRNKKQFHYLLNAENWKKLHNIEKIGVCHSIENLHNLFGNFSGNSVTAMDGWNHSFSHAVIGTKEGGKYLIWTEDEGGIMFFISPISRKCDEVFDRFSQLKDLFWDWKHDKENSKKEIKTIAQAKFHIRDKLYEINQEHFLNNNIPEISKNNIEYNIEYKGHNFHIVGTQYFCGDREQVVTEFVIDIDNKYWWKNGFDFGDIIGKLGESAIWAKPEKYTENEKTEIANIGKILNIGIRM